MIAPNHPHSVGDSVAEDSETTFLRTDTDRPTSDVRANAQIFPRPSLRVRASNLNHHLWNNNGTWYVHYTVHPTPLTKSRIRASLETKSVEVARKRRDEVLTRAGACL
ncbi:MAG: hypothetical protein Q8M02_08835 [Candidatus Didemnitutus sp.]|nr:hypothetical protein [Candidatus Didemnitutus sp.]